MNKITKKVKKLLDLASSNNEHEAKLAAERANEIMVRHNLLMRDIQADDYQDSPLCEGNKLAPEWKFVCMVLESCFFVTCYKCRDKLSGKSTIHIYGEPHNVEIATYVAHFLRGAMAKLFKYYRADNEGVKLSHRQAYYLGLAKGLISQLKDKQRQVVQELGLAIIRDPKLDNYLQQIGAKTRTAKINGNAKVSNDGFQQGRNLQIQNGLDSKSENRGRLIG